MGALEHGLTVKQKKHADLYLKTGNGTQAAMAVYDVESDKSAASMSSQNLAKLKVQKYIISKAAKAAGFVFELAEGANNETVRLNASRDILDRAGFKAVEETKSVVEHVYSGGIDIAVLALKAADELKMRKLSTPDVS